MEQNNYTKSLPNKYRDKIKLQCPKCASKRVRPVIERVTHYYDRNSTYVKDDMFCCINCLYLDFYPHFIMEKED
jgi:hypothetical protein